GNRSAFSAGEPTTRTAESSPYRGKFHQGATIVPRNFYFVTVHRPNLPFNPDRVYHVETDREQARTAKKPYNEIFLDNLVEGQFLFKTAIAKNVLPFLVLDPVDVVLPVEVEEEKAKIKAARELKDEGFRYVGDWFEQAEREWEKHRGA